MSTTGGIPGGNVGIQSFIAPAVDPNIPEAKNQASTVTNEVVITSHYSNADLKTISERYLSPEVGDGECLRPEVFNKILNGFVDRFDNHGDPEVMAFVDEVLKPIVADKELLQAYRNLMIGG